MRYSDGLINHQIGDGNVSVALRHMTDHIKMESPEDGSYLTDEKRVR